MRIAIIIPAYNEAGNINNVLLDIKSIVQDLVTGGDKVEIIVIDDGSYDKTAQLAKEIGVTILRHCVNRGQGAALMTGTQYCLLTNADIIVHFDADGQHDPKDILVLIKELLTNKYDIILGSRFLGRAINIPFLKLIVLKCGVVFTRIFSGIKITDPQNGLRVLTKNAASLIRLTQDKMAHASELLDEIKRNNLKFKEIGVTVRYTPYSLKKGQSVFNAINIVLNLISSKIYKKF